MQDRGAAPQRGSLPSSPSSSTSTSARRLGWPAPVAVGLHPWSLDPVRGQTRWRSHAHVSRHGSRL